ncbi:MAG: helix-turn-helix transcriptional regulator [Hyphomicrobiales bacterium]
MTDKQILLGKVSDEDTKALLDDVAALCLVSREKPFFSELASLLRRYLPVRHVSIFEFRKNLQPQVLYAEGTGFDQDLRKYLNGLYLLDPFYSMFEHDNELGVHYVNLENLESSDAEDTFKLYWRRLSGNGELAGLYEIEPGRCMHVSVMLQTETAEEAANALAFAKGLEQMFLTLFKLHFRTGQNEARNDEAARRELHVRVSKVLDEFGANMLTGREQEVVKLLLKGNSAKSIANILGITPGTASIHRSNIYEKFGVSGQGDLFSIFLSKLVSA